MPIARAKDALSTLVRTERALLAGVAGVGALRLISSLVSVVLTLLLARLLAPAGFGAYSFAFSAATLVALPLLQGLPTLVLREAARENGPKRTAVVGALLGYSHRLILGIGLSLALLAGLIAWTGLTRLGLSDLPLALAAIGVPVAMVASLVRGAVIRSEGRAIAGQIPDMIVRPLGFLILISGFLLWGRASPERVMGLHFLAAILALLVAKGLMGRSPPDSEHAASEFKRWTLALLPLSTVAGMQLVNSQIDLVALGLLASKHEVGIYKVASTLALQVSFVLTIVNAVAAPRFAALFHEGRIAELKRLNHSSAAISFTAGLLVTVLFAVFGRWILRVAVGEEFLPAYLPLMILSAAHLLTLWAGTTNVLLNMIGRERDVLVCAGVSVVVNTVLNIALIPAYGMIGSAMGSAVALVVWRILLSYFLRRRLDAVPA
ncbi:polysaccharide biosynthesis C-terminal domain-containing protein [Arenimonas oryziterrae]|uniref:Uncharacterized protein n=1 Tax=Arenimonas oryziterrae DSM 21050 = YC6267 TaxID=1121015 RepID=A0A091AXN0_9GAMM|nr:polysaccharide biosynthesis C-terminal domain-containing protein [Arenimonas oryziterrae]KFN45078.1 hypothetical protein N789_03385 [Arenimonas oryziterrae DSM 21050 = YC6267]